MRIFITGITGFAGSHLVDALLADRAASIVGIARNPTRPADCDSWENRVHILAADLCDTSRLESILQETKPQQIYHLAGSSSVGQSFKDPQQSWQVNVEGTRSLYAAIIRWGGDVKVLYVGSGLAYGDSQMPDTALTEEHPFYPSSPYAVSKAAADLLSYQHRCWPGLAIVRARPFNHIGPRQSAAFALPNFARQLAEMELGRQPPILKTGNLDAFRDFTDVRDIVRGYIGLMEKGSPGDAYNLASGTVVTIEEVLQRLLKMVAFPVTVEVQRDLVRTTETKVTRAATDKIRRLLSWQPAFSLEQTLSAILDFWRRKLAVSRQSQQQ
jgi:GDP-4-dehydro-6-deoxy-D-mannose reductase